MLLVLDDQHKDHLSFLAGLDMEVVKEFCRISMEFIRKGANPKVYQGAAQKLGVPAETVQCGVEGLMYLLTESSKLMVSKVDFLDSILVLGFGEELRQELLQTYLSHRRDVRALLAQMSMDLPHYHHLEWRFDVQLGSRALRRQTTPEVLLKLHLQDGDQQESHTLSTDPVNLLHMTRVLDEALQEIKSGYCRRILRNIK